MKLNYQNVFFNKNYTLFDASRPDLPIFPVNKNGKIVYQIYYSSNEDPRPFYGELVDFMSSGPIVAAILEKENAVADFRTLIGATNPANAEEGTIRKMYAKSVGENAVHGSDSDENAAIEGSFFFSAFEKI